MEFLNYDSDLETVGSGRGNTRDPSPPLVKKVRVRVVPGTHWCFTYNNYTDSKKEILETFLRKETKKFVFGHELGVNMTPHLQGFACFKKKTRPVEACGIKEIHWEKSKVKNEEAAIRYCCKEDPNPVHMGIDVRMYKPKRAIVDPLEGKELFWWQKEILDMVEQVPDDRSIYWYWDSEGRKGKTSLAKHLVIKRVDAIAVDGCAKDVMHGIVKREEENRETNVVIFDFVRSKENYISYEAIEKLKNGFFFSGKYESSMFVGNCPHVICFANFAPQEEKLSGDRWIIKNIN